LRDLLLTRPTKEQSISDLLVNTTGWWIDVFAPTNDEMRNITKVQPFFAPSASTNNKYL
jgi:Mg2+ and Co2+ transporter CorA